MILHQFAEQSILNRLTNLKKSKEDDHIVWENLLLNCSETKFQKNLNETSLTILANIHGETHCNIDRKPFKICSSTYLIVNPFQQLDYTIDGKEGTETANIHFNYSFIRNLCSYFMASDTYMLDDIDELQHQDLPHFFNELYYKDKTVSSLVQQLLRCKEPHEFEEKLNAIALQLLLNHQYCCRKIKSLKSRKISTKRELYKRVSFAKDIMFSNYEKPLSIEEISKEACLSKHHFTRLFKDVYGVSPYQFLKTVRLEKAKELLSKSYSLEEIAARVGFAESNSFINAFKHYTKDYPTLFRNQISKNE